MKKGILLTLLLLVVCSAAAAHARLPEVILGPGLNSGRTEYHQVWNRTLSADTLYTLTGLYNVDSTFVLNIPAGTVVQGDTAACLIVKRGAQIFAEGTQSAPIVFTSRKPAGTRAPGDWGGILILGRAPVNKVEPLIEGGIIAGTYGGSDPNDDSGVFKYVRIEYPGYRFRLNNEVNGLTMGGVGKGTEIHHVQVSYSFDDMFEWFGGTVDCSHLVAFGGTDDEFDTDFGYNGTVQFAFGLRDMNYWDPTGESNGFESDNDGSSTSTAEPYTEAIFSNITLVGPERTDAWVGNLPVGQKYQYSAVLRRSTRQKIYNSVIAGYPWGFTIRDPNTITGATSDILQVRNTSLTASLNPSGSTTPNDESRWAGVTTWLTTPGWDNYGFGATRLPSAVGLTDMSDLNAPNPVPLVGSEPDTGSVDYANPYLAGFTAVDYRGAFEPGVPMHAQWTAGWTDFTPNTNDYHLTDVADGRGAPALRRLSQNYPNPFNPATVIEFSVPAKGRVSLKVFDARGREVATLVDGELPEGAFRQTFTAPNLPSGNYFYRLSGNGFSETQKMTLLK